MASRQELPAHLRETSNRAGVLTHQGYERLREAYPASLSQQDLLSYLMSQQEQANTTLVNIFTTVFRKHSSVNWNPKTGQYRYQPPYDISTATELLQFLQEQELAKPIPVEELKKGWADCVVEINKLDKEHKIIVLRHKKDQSPRMIWANDPTLYAEIDKENVEKWHKISLPNPDDIRIELGKMSSKAAGQAPKPINAPQAKTKGPKKSRRGVKVTNTHMLALDATFKKLNKR
jgi:hypothetical protein